MFGRRPAVTQTLGDGDDVPSTAAVVHAARSRSTAVELALAVMVAFESNIVPLSVVNRNTLLLPACIHTIRLPGVVNCNRADGFMRALYAAPDLRHGGTVPASNYGAIIRASAQLRRACNISTS